MLTNLSSEAFYSWIRTMDLATICTQVLCVLKVLVNLYAAHMDPKAWKDPDVFRPERFLDNENNGVDSNRIIPFSTGKIIPFMLNFSQRICFRNIFCFRNADM